MQNSQRVRLDEWSQKCEHVWVSWRTRSTLFSTWAHELGQPGCARHSSDSSNVKKIAHCKKSGGGGEETTRSFFAEPPNAKMNICVENFPPEDVRSLGSVDNMPAFSVESRVIVRKLSRQGREKFLSPCCHCRRRFCRHCCCVPIVSFSKVLHASLARSLRRLVRRRARYSLAQALSVALGSRWRPKSVLTRLEDQD